MRLERQVWLKFKVPSFCEEGMHGTPSVDEGCKGGVVDDKLE